MLGYRRRFGVLAEEAAPRPEDPVGRLLEEFVEFLSSERGLAPRTIVGYRHGAGLFLTSCTLDAAVEGWGVERSGAE